MTNTYGCARCFWTCDSYHLLEEHLLRHLIHDGWKRYFKNGGKN